jgi:hypothetical protein
MAATLKTLRDAKVRLAVPVVAGYDAETGEPIEDAITITYFCHVYDAGFEQKATEILRERDPEDVLLFRITAHKFLHVVASWDLKANEDDAEPIPLTEDALAASGVTRDVLEDILTAVNDDRAKQRRDTKPAPPGPRRVA